MKSQDKITKFTIHALDKMFREVGMEGFDEEFVKNDRWYELMEWSEEQERSYRKWFINECVTKLRMNKKSAELEAGYFLLCWGWKTLPEPNI